MTFTDLFRKLFPTNVPASKGLSFAQTARRFYQRLPTWNRPARCTGGPCVGVLVAPWVKTAVPFFTLECALALRDAGCRIRIFWDASDLVGNAANEKEIQAIRRALDLLPKDLEVVDVAALPATGRDLDEPLAAAIIRENAVWKMRGESGAQRFIDERPAMQASVCAHLAKVLELLGSESPDWVLIPGGIYGVSAAYLAAAKQLNRSFSVFDSGPGLLLLSHIGIAAHHGDTPMALDLLESDGDIAEIDFALREGARELERRVNGTDEHAYQLAPATGSSQGDANILVPLNLRWDAAALSRLRLFDSVEHWLTQLLEWAVVNPEARICVRQHPVERNRVTSSRDDVAGLLHRYPQLAGRVRYVAAADPVNSFDLMREAKVVLPFTSSAGMEAAMLGRPVVLGTECYYEHLPFVSRARSVAEYFELIGRAIKGELEVSAEGKRAATLAYYFTQRCAYLRTKFTPVGDDFETWCAISPADLWAQPELVVLLETLLTRCPLPFVQHKRFFLAAL